MPSRSNPSSPLARAAFVGLGYFALAHVGLASNVQPEGIAAVWPASGFGLAVMLLSRREWWPAFAVAILVANFAANATDGASLPVSAGFALANCVEPLLAAALLRRLIPGRLTLTDLSQVVWFLGVAVVGANAVTAVLGAATASLGLGAPFGSAWLLWWTGDGLGMLMVAPAIAAFRAGPRRPWSFARAAEALVVLGALCAVAVAVFAGSPSSSGAVIGFPYLIFPFTVWAGLRLGPRTSAVAFLFLVPIAGLFTAAGLGPFADPAKSTGEQILELQLFLSVVIAVSLLVVAITAAREAERSALAASERRTREILETTRQAFVSIDDRGVILDWNPAAERTFGWSRDEAVGRRLADTVIPARFRDRHERGLARFLATGERSVAGRRLELPALHRDGHELPVELSIAAVQTSRGHEFHAFLEDIRERKRAEAAVRAAEERFRTAFDVAPIGMALTMLDGRFARVNRALAEITGYSKEELESTSFQAITHPDDLAADAHALRALAAGDIPVYRTEKRYVHPSGRTIWVALQATLLLDSDGAPLHFLAQVLDITEQHEEQARLRHLADHDPLSGLRNRRSFEFALEEHVASVGARGAALVIDLDGFKAVNDSLGHAAGDEIIVATARALRGRLRETDVVARLGGDEFAALLPGVDAQAAEMVARDVLAGLDERVTASVGIALFGHDGVRVTAKQVLANADLAMYDAKRSGRNGLAFHTPWAARPRTASGGAA